MTDRRAACVAAMAFILLLSACAKGGEASGPEEGGEPVATVSVATVDRGPVQETVETFGTVEFDPHRTRSVSFVKAGQVARILATPGQGVRSGEPLLTLGPLPGGSLEVEKARIDLEYAEHDLERVRRLRETELATNEQLQQAEKEVATAKAVLAGLGVGAGSAAEEFRAPFSGVVVKVLVTSGSIVQPGQDAILLAPERGVLVVAGFEPEDAADLKAGQEVGIEPVFPAGNARPVRAVLSQLHRVVDPASQLVEAFLQPDETVGWMAVGTQVRARVTIASRASAIRVPREAIVERGGVRGVFVVADGRARFRPVRAGIEEGAFVEALEGVRVGERVAVTGRSALTDGMRVAAEGPGSR